MNYTSSDVAKHFKHYEKHITHYAVLHTKLRANGCSSKKIEHMLEEVRNSLRLALNIFERQIYEGKTNLPRRKPFLYKTLRFVTVEGATDSYDKEKTIHINLMLGNLPEHITTTHVLIYLHQAWTIQCKQGSDIFVEKLEDNSEDKARVANYSVKEGRASRERVWSTHGIWDVNNCWIPHEAFA
jgi:hypothetical protein